MPLSLQQPHESGWENVIDKKVAELSEIKMLIVMPCTEPAIISKVDYNVFAMDMLLPWLSLILFDFVTIWKSKYNAFAEHGWQSVECETGGSAKTSGRLISGFAKRICKT